MAYPAGEIHYDQLQYKITALQLELQYLLGTGGQISLMDNTSSKTQHTPIPTYTITNR